ncbi:putative lipopolysaccharide heptosyltransferase III [Rahnella victoriana]|uniref:Lipopolysaccharide heptosyltransferase III n=2 Tax=Rahnella victoriana TaxID=1510570 RepID=A0ABS0DLN0_9GAMM|nr:putative lipopolysaccharide heptosyltransferase III [Rahnella victoriana]
MDTEMDIREEIVFSPDLPDRDPPARILVIKLRHFGDVLLITPLISTLKANYPRALIDVLVYGGTEVMLAGNKALYLTYTVDRTLKQQGLKQQYRGERALLNSLRGRHYDLILNLSDQWRAAFYCYQLHPKFSIGFRYPRRDNLLWRFCHSALVDTARHASQHTVMNNLSILQPLALRDRVTDVTMACRQRDVDHLALLCGKTPLTDYIVIQPSARWAFKNWSMASYSKLIDHLMQRGEKVVITGGPSAGESDTVRQILDGCLYPQDIINLAGKLDMPELAVLIDRAKLFIGVDSAPMHMAAALQTPSVVLFGPSNLRQWHPWQAPHTLIWAGNYRPLPSPEDIDTGTAERYLDAIPVADVITAVSRRLALLNAPVIRPATSQNCLPEMS